MSNIAYIHQNLNLHSSGYKIIENLDDYDGKLPASWASLFEHDDFPDKKQKLLAIWQPFEPHLFLTIKLIRDNLTNLYLVQHRKDVFLLYVFDIDGDIVLYIGGLPLSFTNTTITKPRLPADVYAFYNKVHNGWLEVPSMALGFKPIEDIKFLDEWEWGILDDVQITEFDIKLNETYAIFNNAASGYLCLKENVPDPISDAVIWWADEKPDPGVNFWDVIDSWIEIGITN
ncbi:MAG: hypothetical protein JWR38_983 [Mucilaginibacter sp.]|nr:hypothetical protein [Mucilaginibacter sp.]